MSSIPLAALAYRNPEVPNYAQQQAQALAVVNAQQEQQFQRQQRPLQLQQEQNTVEQQNMQLQSERALMQAYNEAGGDLDKAVQLAPKYGALPKDIIAWRNLELDHQQKLANLSGKQLENATQQNGVLGSVAGALLQVPPEQRPQAISQFAPQLGAVGIDLTKTAPEQLQNFLSDDYLKHLQIGSLKANEQMTQQRETTKFNQEHGPLPADKLDQINQALAARYQVSHPNQKLPDTYQLPQGATVDDFSRIDKVMEQTEKASATQAQRDTANGFRAQAAALASLAAQEKVAQLNKPTADEQRRADLADNLEENLSTLQDIVKRRPDLFGAVGGRLTGLKQFVGSNDPDIGTLETIKHQLGMAQISAHGMRSAQGIAGAATSILNDFKNGPEAINSSIDAARNSVQTFKTNIESARSGARTGITPPAVPGAKPKAPPSQQAAPRPSQPKAGDVQQGYTFIGGDPSSPNSWKKN